MSPWRGALLFVVLLAPGLAWSNQLRFVSAPSSLPAGRPSNAILVERDSDTGTPLGSGQPALTVTVTSSSSGAGFDADAGFGDVKGSLTLTIPAGASQGGALFYGDSVPGTTTLSASAAGFTSATTSVSIDSLGFAADGESDSLLREDAPRGQWDLSVIANVGDGIASVATAAHRGGFGYRFTDGFSGAGSGDEVGLAYWTAPFHGSYYERAWVRLQSQGNPGAGMLVQVVGFSNPGKSILDLGFKAPGGTLTLGGFQDSANAYDGVDLTAAIGDGQWHLLEVGLEGINTPSGTERAWLDGVAVGSMTGRDWQATNVIYHVFGENYSDDLRFIGTVEMDDVRGGPLPPASHFVFPSAPSLHQGGCEPMLVGLASSSGAAAQAPYDVEASLGFVDAGARLYADARCTTGSSSVLVPRGATQGTAYLSADAEGRTAVTVSHPDFFSAQQDLNVGAAIPGQLEPSVPTESGDGGPQRADARGHYAVGCGCGQSDGAAGLVLGVVLLGWVLRRTR